MSKIHDEFCRRVEETSAKMDVKRGIKSPRKGAGRLRDSLVFFKGVWSQAESWIGLPRALVYWLALTPLAIASFNGFMAYLGLESFQIPIELGSVLAVIMVVGLAAFGFLAWTRLGLRKGQSELGGKQDPVYTLLYDEIQQTKTKLDRLEKIIKDDRK